MGAHRPDARCRGSGHRPPPGHRRRRPGRARRRSRGRRREAELREAARIAARADEVQALRELGTLEQTEPREGDEAVRDELTRRAGPYVQADVDAWLAHALAAHLGHYRDPAAREAAAGLLLRAIIVVTAELVRDSCGYGVPFMSYDEDRDLHGKRFSREDDASLSAYFTKKDHIAQSIDGLPGLPLPLPPSNF
ncbi:hypothetical protein ABZX62_26565 [Streptomyces flavidovirens]|uniref:hypothetical protein n=1 Tax=Streptomyces flavidovirens TaxID=67298 RepID=UPI0033B6A320